MPSRVSLPDIYMLQTFFPTQVVSTASISTTFKDLPTSTCKTASRSLFYTVTIFTKSDQRRKFNMGRGQGIMSMKKQVKVKLLGHAWLFVTPWNV